MPIGPARMPLFDHLGELRRRLTIVVVSVFAAAIVLYFATPVVLDILEDPIRSFVPDGKFYITTTLGGFGLRFSLAIKMAVVMCTPMIIWQILAFFLPALRPNERKWVVPTVLASTVLFFLGAIFCYFIIIPAGFEWLIGETSAVATALPDLENYVNMELLFMIGFGVAFELPLIIFYLSVFHIVSYAAFRSAWRYVYVGLLVGSAVITPDGSPLRGSHVWRPALALRGFARHRSRGHYRARGQGGPVREPSGPVLGRRGRRGVNRYARCWHCQRHTRYSDSRGAWGGGLARRLVNAAYRGYDRGRARGA